MIREERVKELFHAAVYDENEEETMQKVGRYYSGDYVAKELVKSFFSGTIAFLLVVAVAVLNVANSLLDELNSMDYEDIILFAGVSYIAFLALYLLATYLIYQVRYANYKKVQKKYISHLKKISRMYSREEKLKS